MFVSAFSYDLCIYGNTMCLRQTGSSTISASIHNDKNMHTRLIRLDTILDADG